MTVVAFANVVGQARGEPIRLANRRRRLSTIVARHRPAGRRFIVSVHRNGLGELALQPSDATVRLKDRWVHTIKVGDAIFWTEADGIVAPFNTIGGDAASAAAIEFLYESASHLAVGDAIGT